MSAHCRHPDLVEPADGIVVLTGGYSRIEGALELLKNKRGERLFISGVHSSTNRSELQRVTGGDATLFECCVDIDRSAMDTIGNAAESVKWAKANHYEPGHRRHQQLSYSPDDG